MYYAVYQTTNLVNDKTYIGVHATEDLNDSYLGSGKTLKAAVRKYGRASFKKVILFVFDNPEDMSAKEIELVTREFVDRTDTYNLVPGGHQGDAWYQARKKMSSSPEYSETLRRTTKGLVSWNESVSPEFRKERAIKASRSAISKTRRFSEADVRDIRERYASGKISMKGLARELQTRKSVISDILNRRSYKEVEPVGDRACLESSAPLVRGVGVGTLGLRRFSQNEVREILRRYENGESAEKLSVELGAARSTIYDLVKRRSYKDVGGLA